MSPDPPTSQDTLDQIRPKRWPILLALLAIAAIAATTLILVITRATRAARSREARAWSTLQRCLLGPDSLTPPGAAPAADPPTARLRRIQLTAVGIPWRAKGQDAWPGWCSAPAHSLHEALNDAGHAQNGAKDLAYWSEHLGKELHDHPYPETDIAPLITALWAAAKTQDLPASDADEVPAAPAPATPLTVDALQTVPPLSPTTFSLDLIHDEHAPSETMHLLVEGPQVPRAPFLCTIAIAGDTMTCATLPPALESVQGRLIGSTEDGAAPLLFAAPVGEAGIYRSSDGTLFDQAVSYGGLSRADGFAADLAWDSAHSQFRLRRGRPGQPPRDTLFKLDGVEDNAQVAMRWDALIWAANGTVNVRHVLDADVPMGAPAVVATVPEGGIVPREPLRTCKTSQALALLVEGAETDTLTIDTGDTWSTPATFPAFGARRGILTCRGTEAAFTSSGALNERGWVEGSVTQARCSPGECTTTTTQFAKVFPDVKETMPTRFAAADLDGKLLLVWQAGAIGGLRMRLAPQDRIGEPTDVVLYDDLVKDGALQDTSTLLGWDFYPRGAYSVLLLSTTAGVHVLRIDGTGKVAPLRVEWAKGP